MHLPSSLPTSPMSSFLCLPFSVLHSVLYASFHFLFLLYLAPGYWRESVSILHVLVTYDANYGKEALARLLGGLA